MPGSFLELNRKFLHVCSVTLQYNVQNLCEKTDHYESNEKKKKLKNHLSCLQNRVEKWP